MAKPPKKFVGPGPLKQVLKTKHLLVEAGCSGKGVWVKWKTFPKNKPVVGWTNYTMMPCGHPNQLNLLLWLKKLRRLPGNKHYQKTDAFEFVTNGSKYTVTERFLRSDYKDASTGELMTTITYKSTIKLPSDPLAKPHAVVCKASVPRKMAANMAESIIKIFKKCCKS